MPAPTDVELGSTIALKKVRAPQHIKVCDVSYVVKAPKAKNKPEETRALLESVSVEIEPKSLCVIMGPSGAGKTTLLNMIANRIKPSMGRLCINDREYRQVVMGRRIGYVMQDDVLFATQTVKETLLFASKLLLPQSVTSQERRKRVDDLITELGLQKCMDQRIGGGEEEGRGISGGERKRVSIAIALMPDPDILLLDEPTTGLDSYTAEAVMETLKELADNGRTIVCTLHQPSADIMSKVSQLVLLADGRVVYSGKADKAVDYFAEVGYPCSVYNNPADHFLRVLQIGDKEAEAGLRDKAVGEAISKELALKWRSREEARYDEAGTNRAELTLDSGVEEVDYSGYAVGLCTQLTALFVRSLQHFIRSPELFVMRIVQCLVIGLLCGTIFWNLGDDAAGVDGKMGALFFLLVNQSVLPMFAAISVFPDMMRLVLREHSSSFYSIPAYFLAVSSVELPLNVLFPTILCTSLYWMIGLRDGAEHVVMCILFVLMVSFVGESVGMLASAMCRTVHQAISVGPVVLIVQLFFAGYLVRTSSIPGFLIWLDRTSYLKWSFQGIMANEFSGRTLDCPPTSQRCFSSGDELLSYLEMEDATSWRSMVILVGHVVILRLMVLGVLLYKSTKKVQQ